ncbi:hypothetical protein [Terribacillus saccharophilus]|uniref:hypothetical protein n=1 Tax=Terribacillus saccharophilus TaxID=361277 RepID=UPI0029899EDA|nr:hypothetical protein [Terribacillus saccharophilus]MCM3227561.1 hypothetical protein [Terribacillus saccharophilus]
MSEITFHLSNLSDLRNMKKRNTPLFFKQPSKNEKCQQSFKEILNTEIKALSKGVVNK